MLEALEFAQYEQGPQIETMTVQEVCDELRELGIHTSPVKVRTALAQGKYPFGICVRMKEQECEIYRTLFDEWVAERLSRKPAGWWKKEGAV